MPSSFARSNDTQLRLKLRGGAPRHSWTGGPGEKFNGDVCVWTGTDGTELLDKATPVAQRQVPFTKSIVLVLVLFRGLMRLLWLNLKLRWYVVAVMYGLLPFYSVEFIQCHGR